MRTNKTKRILVTGGGAGFLGSHLCKRLYGEGWDVLCVDNFNTRTKDSIAHPSREPHFELLRHEVAVPLDVEVDEFYNLSCPATLIQFRPLPVDDPLCQGLPTVTHCDRVSRFLGRRNRADDAGASSSGFDAPRMCETRPCGRPFGVSGRRPAALMMLPHHGATHSSPETSKDRHNGLSVTVGITALSRYHPRPHASRLAAASGTGGRTRKGGPAFSGSAERARRNGISGDSDGGMRIRD